VCGPLLVWVGATGLGCVTRVCRKQDNEQAQHLWLHEIVPFVANVGYGQLRSCMHCNNFWSA
jgi:hypothetical protein